MIALDPAFYSSTIKGTWKGRNDGENPSVQRWHQRIISVNVMHQDLPVVTLCKKNIALIGFACDEGVMRNGGREGAKDGPICFRQACGNLPVHFDEGVVFADLGDITCEAEDMENAQKALATLVEHALKSGYQPLVIGGGHEMTYGHYSGISRHFQESIGIINMDAHFDLREPAAGLANSGTGFYQIASECHSSGRPFNYLPIGIQRNSNTKQLYQTAAKNNVKFIPGDQFCVDNEQGILLHIEEFLQLSTHIYLTIDLDVFSFSVAPGVSAPAYSGIFPDPFFFKCLNYIIASGKLVSMDIAEYNPLYDPDHRTAKLAAALAFNYVTD